ncbi:MAG: DUF4349 domain-containing protein [Chloroflexi bacterium]|nr:DUF4349 domain-containing protein [Chloroflexota bacterium]
MRKAVLIVPLMMITSLLIVACGGADTKETASFGDDAGGRAFPGAFATPAPFPTPAPANGSVALNTFSLDGSRGPAGAAGSPGAPAPSKEGGSRLGAIFVTTQIQGANADRRIISTASTTLTVDDVEAAISQVRVIAELLGGFVGMLNSSGSDEQRQAQIVIRVPGPQFFAALDRIEALGEVRQRNVGTEDVTTDFIDLEARLKSSLREEESLLALLSRTETISDIITLERELTRIRSEVERLQGQINFLQGRVDLATISVLLFPPDVSIGMPPSASLIMAARDVLGTSDRIRDLVESLDGVIERSIISIDQGKGSARLVFRVSSVDFDSTLITIERMGSPERKEVQQGTGERAEDGEKPNSRFDVTLVQKESDSRTLAIVLISVLGSLALISVVSGAFWVGRRR